MKTPFDAPSALQRKVFNHAPHRTTSENWGRQGGFYGDDDVTTCGFESVLIYVRKGLGHQEVIKPVVDFVLAVQNELEAKWPLIPLSYGKEKELNHLGTSFTMGFVNDRSALARITSAVCELAGQEQEEGTSLVHKIFPKTDMRSFYTGKVAVKRDDLLVFVDYDGELFFHPSVKNRLRIVGRNRMVFVGVDRGMKGSTWTVGSNLAVFKEDGTCSH